MKQSEALSMTLDLLDDLTERAEKAEAATASLLARIDALERREAGVTESRLLAAVGEKGAEIVSLSERLAEVEARTPEKGDPGEVDMEAVRSLVDEMAQQAVNERLPDAVKAISVPQAPEPIAPDMEAIAALIQDGIAKAVAGMPAPEKGEPGIGVAGGMIDREGDLVLTLSNGETCNVGRVVGKDGESPPPFTLDDFDVEAIDERTIRLGFTGGAERHTFELSFPVLIGRGIWAEGEEYERGDVVTWGGSAWEAVEPEKGVKPDMSSGGWRILAKRGRDGKAPK